MPPPRASTVGATTFLKFPLYFYYPKSPPSTKTFLYSTTTEFRAHQISSSSSYSSSLSPYETPQKTFLGSPYDLVDKSNVYHLHSQAIKTGSTRYQHICNHLLNLYVRRRYLDQARKLFDEIPDRDVRTWTILIMGFTQMGLSKIALDLFNDMQMEGVYPNHFTLSLILKCCANVKNLEMGKGIHGWILRNGVELDVVLENSIIDLYVKCGAFDYARRFFELMPKRDTVSWNIMIGAYLELGDMEESIELFRRLPKKDVASWNTIIIGQIRNGFNVFALELLYQMRVIGPVFNEVTFSIALLLASSLSILELGRQIHCIILRTGFNEDKFMRNSLIDMYCKCGAMDKASDIFNRRHRNSTMFHSGLMESTIYWSSIVSGYVQNGRTEEAFELFGKMVREGFEVDRFTLSSIASACADDGIIEQGRQIHAFIEKLGHELDVFLVSVVIDMYAKCGSLDDALSMFYKSKSRNIVLWTSIISGCSLHGQGREAIELFQLMLKEGIRPNEISFVGILSGCSHAGLVKEGFKYFKLMQEDYDLIPGVEHFTCMVDLLGRAGHLNEAKEFIYKNRISHMNAVWTALLSACRVHKNSEMGRWASEQLLKLEPLNAGSYVLLSNICATTHNWNEAAETRGLMQKRGIKKRPGQSWIQLKGRVHTFIMGEKLHPQTSEIYSYLEKLIGKLKELGYSPDTDLVMHDVEEEQKEVLLGFHSEKLAIAYGLMSTPCGSPIRIMKNLRVCIDCHTAMKYISRLTYREITVRDARRFHHFKQGQCSCGDYW